MAAPYRISICWLAPGRQAGTREPMKDHALFGLEFATSLHQSARQARPGGAAKQSPRAVSRVSKRIPFFWKHYYSIQRKSFACCECRQTTRHGIRPLGPDEIEVIVVIHPTANMRRETRQKSAAVQDLLENQKWNWFVIEDFELRASLERILPGSGKKRRHESICVMNG